MIVAARIAEWMRGGETLVSAVMRALVEGASEFRFDDAREIEPKGRAGPHRVYAAAWDAPGVPGG